MGAGVENGDAPTLCSAGTGRSGEIRVPVTELGHLEFRELQVDVHPHAYLGKVQGCSSWLSAGNSGYFRPRNGIVPTLFLTRNSWYTQPMQFLRVLAFLASLPPLCASSWSVGSIAPLRSYSLDATQEPVGLSRYPWNGCAGFSRATPV